jgi:hypothetical protein
MPDRRGSPARLFQVALQPKLPSAGPTCPRSASRVAVAHAYFALDLDILWDAIQRDIPALQIRIRQIIESEME